MFIALVCSFLFSIVYGYIAAHSRRAEKVLVPLLDVLQSIPVLGFLSVTVTGFIALFRGSLLGLEAAAIFAIFTGQAWNMTFSVYHSLRTLPKELDEMLCLYRLSRWERFTRLELPSSAIGLVWNSMMSFGGGWFFLAASEAITVLNRNYTFAGSRLVYGNSGRGQRYPCPAVGHRNHDRPHSRHRSVLLASSGRFRGHLQNGFKRRRADPLLGQ